MKTSNYLELCKIITNYAPIFAGEAYFTTVSELAKEMGVSRSTAYRTLEDGVKNMLLFKVETVRGTFKTNHYFVSEQYIKMGGFLPYTHRKLVEKMMNFDLIERKPVEEYLSICNQKQIHEVYENWRSGGYKTGML